MKKIQGLIIMLVIILLIIISFMNVNIKENSIESANYKASLENTSSELIASYIKKGVNIGGIIGILISLIGTLIVGSFMGIKLIMPLWVFALSVGFSLIVGIVFGMYPAIKAAKMHPIDALRHD